MTTSTKALLYGALATSAILLIALFVSTPNGVTLALAVAIGLVVGVSTWYQDSRR